MENTQNKNQLFEIIEKFKNRSAKAEDVLKLAEIICFSSPYPITHFNSSPTNNLKISNAIRFNFDTKNVVTAATTKEGAIEVKTISSETGNTNIEVSHSYILNINADYVATLPLSEVLQIIGHEMRHFFQAQSFKSIILNQPLPIKINEDTANSMSYGMVAQNSLSELIKLAYIAKDRNFEPAVIREYINSSKDPNFYLDMLFTDGKNSDFSAIDPSITENPKAFINYFAYLQLKYEEDARVIGANFAETFLNNILTDKLCPPSIKGFVEQNIFKTQDSATKEFKKHSSKAYKMMRVLYQRAMEKAINTDEKDIIKILQNETISPILKNHIKEFRLYDMRNKNVDKTTYYKAVLAYRGKSALANDKPSFYYMMNSNPKEIVYNLLKDINKSVELKHLISSNDALGNINFLNPSSPIYFSPNELANLCFEWLKQGSYNNVHNIFCMDYKNTTIIAPKLTEEKHSQIQNAVRAHKGINDYLTDKLTPLTKIINKKAENVSFEEYTLLKELQFENFANGNNVECAKALNLSVSEYLNILDDIRFALEMVNNLKFDHVSFNDIKEKIDEIDNLTSIKEKNINGYERQELFDFIYNPSATKFIAKTICETKNYTLEELEEYLKRLANGEGFNDGRLKSLHFEMKVSQLIFNSDLAPSKNDTAAKEHEFENFIYKNDSNQIIKNAMKEENLNIKEFEKYLALLDLHEKPYGKYEKFDHNLRRTYTLNNMKCYIENVVESSNER